MNDPRWNELSRLVIGHRLDRRKLLAASAATGGAVTLASFPFATRNVAARQIDATTLVIALNMKDG